MGLTNTLLDGYETARYGTTVFGLSEYLRYQEALSELATVVQSTKWDLSATTPVSSKGLTQSPEASPTHTSPPVRRVNVPKHFLELKSSKDNYNTLESSSGAEGLSLLMEPDRLQCACGWPHSGHLGQPAPGWLKPWLFRARQDFMPRRIILPLSLLASFRTSAKTLFSLGIISLWS